MDLGSDGKGGWVSFEETDPVMERLASSRPDLRDAARSLAEKMIEAEAPVCNDNMKQAKMDRARSYGREADGRA